jgi:hypothetical protein
MTRNTMDLAHGGSKQPSDTPSSATNGEHHAPRLAEIDAVPPVEGSPDVTAPDLSNKQTDPLADLGRLRLSQDFAGMSGVTPVLTTIAVRKPTRHEFVRVRRGEEWRFETGAFIEQQSRETYLVEPRLWSSLPGEIRPIVLLVVIGRDSPVPYLWPCVLPGTDGRPNRWHESALEAARLAEERWVRVVADMTAGCYVPYVAQSDLPDPEWPDQSMDDLLRLAFHDRFIGELDHPVLRRLRGEV